MLPGRVSERARKAEVSATGSQLQIAVTVPVRAPIPASTGKLATMPESYADADSAATTSPRALQPVARARERAVADDEEEVAVAPRYARASPRWRSEGQANVDDAYDEPPAADPPSRGRYRSYREEGRWDDQRPEDRAAPDDRYAPSPYLGERYYPPPWR